MQTFYLGGLKKLLHSQGSRKNVVTQALEHTNYSRPAGVTPTGRQVSTGNASAKLDTFSIAQQISDLLSPAYGMTDAEKAAWLEKIRAKLKSGKRLTPEEMRLLQAEDPILYQQAARVQAMRDSFEAQLKQCSSKEAVANTYATSVSIVSDDDPMKEYIVAAFDDAKKEFENSDAYRALPGTEEEAARKRSKSKE